MRNIRDLETLLAALAELGYSQGKVEVHESAVTLYDYVGKARPERAEVVIRKRNTGIGSSNDIGFKLNKDGCYTAIVSEYDSGALRLQGKTFVTAVDHAYGRLNANKTLQTVLTVIIPKAKLKGLIPRHATMVEVKHDKQIEWKVRY